MCHERNIAINVLRSSDSKNSTFLYFEIAFFFFPFVVAYWSVFNLASGKAIEKAITDEDSFAL